MSPVWQHPAFDTVGCLCLCLQYMNSSAGGLAGFFLHQRHERNDFPKLLGWWGHKMSTRFNMDNSEFSFVFRVMGVQHAHQVYHRQQWVCFLRLGIGGCIMSTRVTMDDSEFTFWGYGHGGTTCEPGLPWMAVSSLFLFRVVGAHGHQVYDVQQWVCFSSGSWGHMSTGSTMDNSEFTSGLWGHMSTMFTMDIGDFSSGWWGLCMSTRLTTSISECASLHTNIIIFALNASHSVVESP